MALFCALGALAGAAFAETGRGAWVVSGNAAARLLAAGPSADGSQRAGIEIRLDPGYLTYWRNPGEAGLPPHFETAGSINIRAVAIAYPAPHRLDEAGAVANGYTGGVVFPLAVRREHPGEPATLRVQLTYGVCGTLCLPASASLALPLPEVPQPDVASQLAEADAAVPRPATVGAAGHPSVISVTPRPGATRLVVTARADPGATLFVAAPSGWYLEPAAGSPDGAGDVVFPVAVLQRPEAGAGTAVPLELTLVDATGAVAVPIRVDLGAGTP